MIEIVEIMPTKDKLYINEVKVWFNGNIFLKQDGFYTNVYSINEYKLEYIKGMMVKGTQYIIRMEIEGYDIFNINFLDFIKADENIIKSSFQENYIRFVNFDKLSNLSYQYKSS